MTRKLPFLFILLALTSTFSPPHGDDGVVVLSAFAFTTPTTWNRRTTAGATRLDLASTSYSSDSSEAMTTTSSSQHDTPQDEEGDVLETSSPPSSETFEATAAFSSVQPQQEELMETTTPSTSSHIIEATTTTAAQPPQEEDEEVLETSSSSSTFEATTTATSSAQPDHGEILNTLYEAVNNQRSKAPSQQDIIDALKTVEAQADKDEPNTLRDKLVDVDWKLVLVTDSKLESVIYVPQNSNVVSMRSPNDDDKVLTLMQSNHDINPRILPLASFIVANDRVAAARGQVGGFVLWKRMKGQPDNNANLLP